MPLTPQEAFKFGFLLRCADENLDDDQIQARVKYAVDRLQWRGEPLIDGNLVHEKIAAVRKQGFDVGGMASGAGHLGSALIKALTSAGAWGLAGGAGIGALGGYTAAKLSDKDIDPEEVKMQELIEAYRQHTNNIRRRTMAQRAQTNPQVRIPQLM